MKKILHKIGVYSLASFVLFLSIGFNISKISCHEKSIIAIGDSQSTCHEDVNNICALETNTESCCTVEKAIECCSSFKNLCDKELSNIKYDFYTLISDKFDLKDVVFNYINIYFFNNYSFLVFYDLNDYDLPPPLSRKLVLSKIQSFLI
tara:strand:+ start:530 stop:976 length:447 start_codon:yes stop_codon:yes gene_type:complete